MKISDCLLNVIPHPY